MRRRATAHPDSPGGPCNATGFPDQLDESQPAQWNTSMTPPGNEALRCALCGRAADPERDGNPPVTGCVDRVETRSGQRIRWVCEPCTRRYVRSIEAKLERDWW